MKKYEVGERVTHMHKTGFGEENRNQMVEKGLAVKLRNSTFILRMRMEVTERRGGDIYFV